MSRGSDLVGGQPGQGPGEHVADEEVRFDPAPVDEDLEVLGLRSGADRHGGLQALLRIRSRQRSNHRVVELVCRVVRVWICHGLHLLATQ
jgi:hypothetical protein